VVTAGLSDLVDRYVADWAALDPAGASRSGIRDHETRLTDYSPDADEERRALRRRALAALGPHLTTAEPGGRIAARFLAERLEAEEALDDAGETPRCLSIIASPVQTIRAVFDGMPTDGPADQEVLVTRLEAVPASIASLIARLDAGRRAGETSAQRQAEACRQQADTWSGRHGPSFFTELVEGLAAGEAVAERAGRAATAAAAAYGELADWLATTYLPDAVSTDAVGAERYANFARLHLGADIDPVGVYEWGVEETRRLLRAMDDLAGEIVPDGGVAAAVAFLETEGPALEGEDALRGWLQDLMDRTIDEVDGRHFTIPAETRRVEAMIAPPGGAAAMYYTPPSEDLVVPGRTWYPTQGRSRFPLWGEVSICYHEGVPGHHLQLALLRVMGDALTRYQRNEFIPGHGEGWALYAERLMDEFGFLDEPGARLGYLRAQLFRAIRVVVDIGLHLELDPPSDLAGGDERWTAENVVALLGRSWFPPEFLDSEVIRYLGLPAQAISYKVGERAWLEARSRAEQADGAAFDLRAFHDRALRLGPLGLDLLVEEVGRGSNPT
jgi:uncharacterized protein (DUF885 family)